MCGFAGEFVFTDSDRADPALAEAMAARLTHRGPDETGNFLSPDGRCAIGFRRLAVIDPAGSHQPMASADGRAVVAFNGEIYNFRALREELARQGVAFRSQGDTEVLPELYLRLGPDMLEALEGMFAFVIYDIPARRLFLARDRLGQKPLWYALLKDRIVFASEAKALLVHPQVADQVDPQAVGFYLTLGYVPAPRSIWGGVRKLPPACWMMLDGPGPTKPRRYWDLPTHQRPLSPAEATGSVRQALQQAVTKRMVADVPLGVLLSGGVDSSIVAALMCQSAGAGGGVKTFTAGFADRRFDERRHAAAVARHLRTDHSELLISPSDYRLPELLDELVDQYDEPFADSSALPTCLICRAARRHVKVALTGDGGDEAFGGYDRYRAMRLGETLGPGRYLAVKLAAWAVRPVAPQDERHPLRRFVRFAEGLDDVPAMQYLRYRRLFSAADLAALLEDDFAQAVDVESAQQWFCELYEQGEFEDELAYAQQHDLRTYLPDDLLVKADIASMASSLELRSPMLDHEVIALGLALPVRYKLRGTRGKAVLRDAFGDLLPPEVFARPKRGFGAPIDKWLKGPLHPLLQETLLDGPLVERGWMKRPALEALMREHLSGRADHRHRLWALLWLGRWLARRR